MTGKNGLDSKMTDAEIEEFAKTGNHYIKLLYKQWMIFKNSPRIEVSHENCEGAIRWCQEHCSDQWYHSRSPELITRSKMISAILEEQGEIQEYLEFQLAEILSNELSVELLLENMKDYKAPPFYFWIEDPDIGMMFKLAWGGK